jgi:hypothetical protein
MLVIKTPREIAFTLASYRYSFQDEKDLQDGVAAALADNQLPFTRECALSKRDRPDFFLSQLGLVIEVKIKFPRSQVLRQLFRYAEYPQVQSLLLLTCRSCHGVPERMNAKPLFVVNVGRL